MDKRLTDAQFDRLFERAVIQNFEDMLDKIPPREELEKTHTFSERHEARMEKMFKRVKRLDMLEGTIRWTRRIAAVIIIILTLSFGVLVALSPEVRAAISETIIRWYEGFTSFISGERTVPDTAPGIFRPGYLPEGFSEYTSIEVGEIVVVIFSDAAGTEIRLTIMPADAMLSVNNDAVNYSYALIDGITFHRFEAYEELYYNAIIWHCDGYGFEIFSSIPLEYLQEIALSIERQR